MSINDEMKDGILGHVVGTDGDLRESVVSYVGEKLKPINDEVTIEMVIDILASEFPEIVLAIAEENFLRGYKKGINDSENGFMANEELPSTFKAQTEES